MTSIRDIPNMSEDELKQHLEAMRLQRKTGYEPKKRKRQDNPFADLDPEVAKKVLEEMKEKGLT